MEHKVLAYVRLDCGIYLQITPEAQEQGFSLNYYLRHSKLQENLRKELDKFTDNFSAFNFNLNLGGPVKDGVSKLQYIFWADGYLDLQEPLFIPHKGLVGFDVHFEDYHDANEIQFLIKEAVKTAIFVSNETLISYVATHTSGLLDKGQAKFLQSGKEILEIDKIGHVCTRVTKEDTAIGKVFENPDSLSGVSANGVEALQEWFNIYTQNPAVSDEDKVTVYLGLAAGLPDFPAPDAIKHIVPDLDTLRDLHVSLNLDDLEDESHHDLDEDDYDRF